MRAPVILASVITRILRLTKMRISTKSYRAMELLKEVEREEGRQKSIVHLSVENTSARES